MVLMRIFYFVKTHATCNAIKVTDQYLREQGLDREMGKKYPDSDQTKYDPKYSCEKRE